MVSASVYAADLTQLLLSVGQAQKNGAGELHVDVIDGHFTSGFGFSPSFVKSLRNCTCLPISVHMQISHPERYLDSFIKAGAESIIFHIETIYSRAGAVVQRIKEAGIQGGVALCPNTKLSCLKECLPVCDSVLLLGVQPGETGEAFLPSTLERIRELRCMVTARGLSTKIIVDGQIQEESGKACVRAGADTLVIGKAFFQSGDAGGLVRTLQGTA